MGFSLGSPLHRYNADGVLSLGRQGPKPPPPREVQSGGCGVQRV